LKREGKDLKNRKNRNRSRRTRSSNAKKLKRGARTFGKVAYEADGGRKQTGEGAYHYTELLQKTLNSIDDATFILDSANPPRILECNDAACTIFGYAKKELLGRNTDVLHVSDKALKKFQSRLYAAVEEHRLPVHLPDFSMKRKDGSVFPSEHFVSQLLDDQGIRNGWVSVVKDVTDRKRAEAALRHRAEELAALQSTVLDITRTQDLDSLLRAIVERAAHLLGAPSGGLYVCDSEAREVRCVVSYNTLKDYTGAVLKYGEGAAGLVAETGEPLVVNDYRVWSGRAKEFESEQPFTALLSTPMIWQGKVRGVIHVLDSEARHFTQSDLRLLALFADHAAIALENQRSVEALRENEERFRKVFDEGPFGLALVRPDYRFARVNKQFCAMLGYSESELTAIKFTDITHPDDIETGVELTEKLFRGEMPSFSIEKRYLKKNGEVLSARLTASFIWDRHGTPVYSVAMIEDITEQKRAEEKLRQSEERHRSLFDRMLDGVYLSTHEGRFVDVNPAFVKMFGYSNKQEMLDITDIRRELYFSAEERGSHVLDTGKEEVEIYRMRRKDGSEIWVEDHGRYVHDEQGRIIYHEGLLRDVTERVRAEQKLRLQAEITENMVEGLVLVREADGVIVQTNPQFDAMFGYSPGGLIGKNITAVNAPIDGKSPADVAKEIVSSLKETGSWSGELQNIKKDGTRFWCHANVSTLASSEYGGIWISTHMDISERKRLEEQVRQHSLQLEKLVDERTRKLRASEEQLQAARKQLEYVIASNPAAIYSGRPLADHSDWRLTYISNRVTTMLGFEPKQFISHSDFWASRVNPDDLPATLRVVPRVFKEGAGTFDYRFLHNDGTYRWIREEAKVIRDADGKPLQVNGYWTDITELKKIELRLAESERLAAIGQTAAMVGHDLRNPLQGIAGAVHLLKQASLTMEEKNEMLQVIEKSLDYSDAIIRDLLDYSAEIRLSLAEATPKSITKDALRGIKIPGNIRLENLSEDQPTLRIDPDRMRRVFINLIENAMDAMPEGGTLTIRSKKSDGNVEIALIDTGSGMSQAVINNLWKPLQTTKAKGLGLGLAICKRILDAHGGSMSIRSEVGVGTVLTLQFPVKSVEVKQR
jgi:PAS domain S-box-containing protein